MMTPITMRATATIERVTAGLSFGSFGPPELRERLVRVDGVRRRVATYTSTTTGKTIGRRLVCS